MKQILFNTEMVRAILDGRKSVTRRVVKGINDTARFLELSENPSIIAVDKRGHEYPKEVEGLYADFVQDGNPDFPVVKAPYRPGDVLYVREAWQQNYDGGYAYRAGHKFEKDSGWRPSIHMPSEAARIFLRVTDVRVERLQEITESEALKEGAEREYIDADVNISLSAKNVFSDIWDNTMNPENRDIYRWDANPWVWVIEFERISKEEAMNNETC